MLKNHDTRDLFAMLGVIFLSMHVLMAMGVL